MNIKTIVPNVKQWFAKKPTVLTQEGGLEISSYRSPYYPQSQFQEYNPDDVVNKKGSLDEYRKMLLDDQVKAVCLLKNQIILGNGYKIECENDEYREFVEYCFADGIDGNFIKVLKGIITGIHYGFSISEKIYKILEEG